MKVDLLKSLRSERSLWAPLMAVTLNVLLLYAVAFVARVEFLLHNLSYFPGIEGVADFMRVAAAGTRFDTPGIFYVNALYILLMLLPLHIKERRGYYKGCKWLYVVTNSIAFAANLADSVYFPFTLRRTTWDVTREFSNEGNLAEIFGVEALHNWPLLLLFAAVAALMWTLYSSPDDSGGMKERRERKNRLHYYLVMAASLAIAACICVSGIRGGWLRHWEFYLMALPLAYTAWRLRRRTLPASVFGVAALALLVAAPMGGLRHRDIRPIAISNANAYARHPSEVALILNTPFTLIRTLNDDPYRVPRYFADSNEIARLYSPIHEPAMPDSAMLRRNVVVIILESFGEEYVDALNDRALGPGSPGYAPFMDSLSRVSMRFANTFDNGNKSIDAMPSVLASIPKLTKSFVLTSSAMQPVDALPALLRRKGYSTAFFHGARTGSMGFDGFARLAGFEGYYGREDFEAAPRFGGPDEFDGYWAIWDEPFMQYYAAKMGEMKQPFMTALFSATSHHPFNVPAKYAGKFPEGTLPIHKCIGYTDMALRRFFGEAKKHEWYKNTIFVITNDHTNQRAYDEYRSDIGLFYGPLLIFDPSGEVAPAGERDGVIQQIDIMPTLLGLLRYPDRYSAYGADLSAAAKNPSAFAGKGWAVMYVNNLYQYVEGDFVLQFDGEKSVALYAVSDHLMRRNLLAEHPAEASRMERRLKALIQTYMQRKAR